MNRIVALVLSIGVSATLVAAGDSDGKRWWSHVAALAGDSLEGRNTGSAGHRKAAEYAIQQFERVGLKPSGVQGFVQPVPFDGRKIVESQSSIELIRNGRAERLTLGEDIVINLRVDPAESLEAPLVFAGYGLTVPEMKFDDLAGLDLKGKIVVTFGGGPAQIPDNLRSHYGYAAERGRFFERAGVVGFVTIQNPRTADIPWARSSLARLQEAMSVADPAVADMKTVKLSATVNPEHADKWLAGSGHSVKELLALVDAGKPLPHFALPSSLKATVKVNRRRLESQNVIAVRPGSDPALRNEHVVLSAHLDHLGVADPINGDSIYNGAMDNASGVASLIEVAGALAENKTETRRSLLFLLVTGEEKGLQGSRYFAAHPTVPARSMVADVNIDMFLPLYPLKVLTVHGVNESDLGDTMRAATRAMGIEVQDDPEPSRNVFVRSDQYSFIRLGVPAVKVDVGYKKGSKEHEIQQAWLKTRYHAPSDDLRQPVDLQAAADFTRAITALVTEIANAPARPQWKRESFFRRFAKY
jgi:Zn-dependent M28 family amino/carboxypeptidase